MSASTTRDVRRLRGGLKLTAFIAVTGALYALHVSTVPLLNLLRLPGGRWSGRIFRTWARWVSRTVGMQVQVEGRPPEAPFLLVSNHLSYVDVLVLGAHLDCVFVARADVAGWPIFGRLCRSVGTIFVDRDRKRDVTRVLQRMEKVLAQGRGVVLFPEGTSSAGETVLPFRPALLAAAARSGRPVFHASLTYQTPPQAAHAGASVCWWGDMTFPGHLVKLFRLPGFRATVRFAEEAICEADRKRLAGRLQEAVAARFEPVSAGVPAKTDSGRLTALAPTRLEP